MYNINAYVNTAYTNYLLNIDLGAVSLNQPYIYIDFQKGGIKPDLRLCSTGAFIVCRIYKTFRRIMIAQFSSSFSPSTLLTFSNGGGYFIYLPKQQQYFTSQT
jgi:hypothetical protein